MHFLILFVNLPPAYQTKGQIMKLTPVLAALAALAAPAAFAEDAPLPFTYAAFDASVTHVDLAQCPGALAGEGRFCRATAVDDKINVFAFADAGEQPLVGFQSWPADLLNGLMD